MISGWAEGEASPNLRCTSAVEAHADVQFAFVPTRSRTGVDGLIDVAVKYVQSLPSPQCEIFFGLIGGATSRPKPDAMAYSHRDAIYVCNVHGRWETAPEDQKCIDWARGFYRDAAPYATGGVYVNFLTDDEPERIRAAYGPEYTRLVAAKEKYDPDNLFRMNQNIRPTSSTE